MIEIDALPQLRDPVMVVVLSGWVDAGMAGAGSDGGAHGAARVGAHVRAHRSRRPAWTSSRRARPSISSTACRARSSWPSIDADRRHASVVTSCCAPARSRRCGGGRCSASSSTLAGAARYHAAFTLGGIPSIASHRRPVSVLATGTDEDLVAEIGRVAQDYTGPTGAAERAAGDARRRGHPHARAVGAGAPLPGRRAVTARDPRRARAAARPRRASQVDLDGARRAGRRLRATGRGRARRPSRRRRGDRRRSRPTRADDAELPSGDELASEIERFLRDQSSLRRQTVGRQVSAPGGRPAGRGRVGPAGPPRSQ